MLVPLEVMTKHSLAEPTIADVMSVLINMDERLGLVQESQRNIEVRIADMQDELSAALTAIDQDSVTLLGHERRITKLESAPVT